MKVRKTLPSFYYEDLEGLTIALLWKSKEGTGKALQSFYYRPTVRKALPSYFFEVQKSKLGNLYHRTIL